MLTSPCFILLHIIAAVTWVMPRPVTKAVEQAIIPLTADDLKTYTEQYARKVSISQMPTKFTELATAPRKAGRIWIASCLAITVTLIAIIFLGPGLGLFPQSLRFP